MSRPLATHTTPGNTDRDTQTETVDDLIMRAHDVLASTGRTVSPSKVSRVIRRYVRANGMPTASSVIDGLFTPNPPATSSVLWYELATINNRHVTIPDDYHGLPPISHMHFGQEAMTK